MSTRTTRYYIILTVIVLVGIFLTAFSHILSLAVALRLTLALPFIFFVPGYLIGVRLFTSYEPIERATLSCILSLTIVYPALFLLERINKKLTPDSVGFTIFTITVLAFFVFLALRSRRPRRPHSVRHDITDRN